MSLTLLTKEEKIRSLVYVTKHELSKDKTIQKKQYEILEIMWQCYIKECDYSYTPIIVKKTDNYNTVYTFGWPEEMTFTNLDEILNEFIYRTELFVRIYFALQEEYNKTYNPSLEQMRLLDFTRYIENWFDMTPDNYKRLYHDKFRLPQITGFKLHDDRRVIV